MIVEKFNRNLEKYSHNLASLRMLRTAVAANPIETVLIYLAGLDEQGKGYFTAEEVQSMWLNGKIGEEVSIDRFIEQYFPFQKISYTVVLHFLTQNEQPPTNISQASQNLGELVKKIFVLELQTAGVEAIVVDKLQKFVPMRYSRPSEEELSRYVICQQLTVDIRGVSRRLNLLESNADLQNKRQELGYQKTLANPSVSNLQDIMKRLQDRVNSFGGEWLLGRESEGWQKNA